MKSYKRYKIIFIIVSGMLLFPLVTFGQCSTDDYLDKCASELGTYNYIKSFSVDVKSSKKNKSEYSYVFSKGSSYLLIGCDENVIGGKMIISLFDRNHILISCTYDETNNKYFSKLQYSCSSTGVYYIKVTFNQAKKGCGLCIIGFNKEIEIKD
jgi:hypothetical protein